MKVFLRFPRIRVNLSSGLKKKKVKNGFLCFVKNKVLSGGSRVFFLLHSDPLPPCRLPTLTAQGTLRQSVLRSSQRTVIGDTVHGAWSGTGS